MESIYADIACRTGGDIYIGVVGPVRTGKSTLVKRIMEQMVIPPPSFQGLATVIMLRIVPIAIMTALSTNRRVEIFI